MLICRLVCPAIGNMTEEVKAQRQPAAGNIIAKAQRLSIDVPEEDTGESDPALLSTPPRASVKGYADVQEATEVAPLQKARTILKEKGTQSARNAKAKVFQFQPKSGTPRGASQAPHVFPIQSSPLLHKGTIKVGPSARLRYLGGVKSGKAENSAVSPPSSTEKPSPAPTESPKKGLSGIVTQVAAPAIKPTPTSAQEVKAKADAIYREHLFQTFQALKFVRNLPAVDSAQLRSKRVTLPKPMGYTNKKTAVFDLDETLVHCCDSIDLEHPDVVLPITFPTGEVVSAGIKVRPYAKECLMETSKEFEVVIFTASHRCYADVVLDYLDPEHAYIHHRLYRENCIMMEGVYIKDLRILGNRPLRDIVIIDNAAYSFGYQLENGVPIISWHDDPCDRELFNLIDYLKALSKAEDVREVNRLTFHLATFYEDYIEEFMSKEQRLR